VNPVEEECASVLAIKDAKTKVEALVSVPVLVFVRLRDLDSIAALRYGLAPIAARDLPKVHGSCHVISFPGIAPALLSRVSRGY
jgi:hypothetical protein